MSDIGKPRSAHWWPMAGVPNLTNIIDWIDLDLWLRKDRCAKVGHRPYETECLNCGKKMP